MEFYTNFVKGMPNEWGGYFFLSNTNRHSGNNDSVVGTIGFLLCHFGEWNKISRKYIEMWDNFHLNWRLDYTIENVTSFWQGFGSKMTDSPWNRVYVTGAFIQEKGINTQLMDFLVDLHTRPANATNPLYACVGTHLGGKAIYIEFVECLSYVVNSFIFVDSNFRGLIKIYVRRYVYSYIP
jgi:hypothetical protein